MQGFEVSRLIESSAALVAIWGVRVVGALALLMVGRIVAGSARQALRAVLEGRGVEQTLVPFLSSLIYYLVMIFVGIAVLGLFGIPTASLIAVLGAAGLAVGLALQGTLSNFAAGVMLLLFRPFREGDFIEAAGVSGTVGSVTIFATTLNTPDNVRIIASNADVYGGTIKNYSANENRRVDMVIGVAYEDDLSQARETIERVVTRDPRVLIDPAVTIGVSELGDSSVNFVVRPWCKKGDYWPLRFDLLRALKEELEKAGCSIPFPQADVHLHQVGRQGA